MPVVPLGCKAPSTERSFNAIVQGLFREELVPPGDVLDAGALFGKWSCYYACLNPWRRVRAVDPLPSNAHSIQCSDDAANRALLRYARALSNESDSIEVIDRRGGYVGKLQQHISAPRSATVRVGVSTIDELFLSEWRSRLGFAHLDLEGYERRAILGGATTIRRDQPIISTELSGTSPEAPKLLALLRSLGYVSFSILEMTGVGYNKRNVLSFPRSQLQRLLDSPTLDLAARGLLLVPVNESTVNRQRSRVRVLSWYNDLSFRKVVCASRKAGKPQAWEWGEEAPDDRRPWEASSAARWWEPVLSLPEVCGHAASGGRGAGRERMGSPPPV